MSLKNLKNVSEVVVEEVVETAIATKPAFSLANLANLQTVEAPEDMGSLYLPSLKFAWPVMNKGGDTNKFFLSDGDNEVFINENIKISYIMSRNFLRVDSVTNKGQKCYLRGFLPSKGNPNGKTVEVYNELKNNPEAIKCTSLVVAVIFDNGAVSLAQVELAKTLESAFFKAFTDGNFLQAKATQLQEHNWSVVMKRSKGGFEYPAKNKVALKYKLTDLTKDEVELIEAEIEKNTLGIENWLAK